MEILEKIVLLILVLYEVLARLIPSIKDYTIIGNIIKFLKWLSDYLNNNEKKKDIMTTTQKNRLIKKALKPYKKKEVEILRGYVVTNNVS